MSCNSDETHPAICSRSNSMYSGRTSSNSHLRLAFFSFSARLALLLVNVRGHAFVGVMLSPSEAACSSSTETNSSARLEAMGWDARGEEDATGATCAVSNRRQIESSTGRDDRG